MVLEHGKIGKFHITPNLVITGVLVNDANNGWLIFDTGGKQYVLRHLLETCRVTVDEIYSTTAKFHNPKIRESFNILASCYKRRSELYQLQKQCQSELYKVSDLVAGALNNLNDLVYSSSGFGGKQELDRLCDTIVEKLSQYTPVGVRYEHNSYFCEFNMKDDILYIRVNQETGLEKYATPDKYCFLYREYDDVVTVDYNHPDYVARVQRMSASDGLHKLMQYTNWADVKQGRGSMSVGDKNWLVYSRDITFVINKKMYMRFLQLFT